MVEETGGWSAGTGWHGWMKPGVDTGGVVASGGPRGKHRQLPRKRGRLTAAKPSNFSPPYRDPSSTGKFDDLMR